MRFARWIGFAAVVIGVATTAGAGNAAPPARFLVAEFPVHSGGPTRLEVVGASGKVLRVLSKNTNFQGIAVSPGKTLVAYPTVKGLVAERIDGSGRRLVVPEHLRCGRHTVCESPSVAWSPDGKELVVGGIQIHNQQPRNWLSVVSVATGRSHQIVGPRPGTNYRVLAWSGAASKIAYVADYKFQPRLVIASPTGRSPHTICSVTCGDPQDDPVIGWSPDGRWIAYPTLNAHLEIFAVGARTTTEIPHVSGSLPLWSSDSRSVAAETGTGVKFFSPTGRVLEATSVTGAYLAAYNADGVYFTTNDQPDSLQLIPAGETASKTVFSLPSGQGILWAEPLQ